MAQLKGIALRDAKRAPMQTIGAIMVTAEHGVTGDFRGRPGKRQVTVLASEAWQAACAEAGVQLPWHTRRANLLVDGVDLAQSTGRTLRVGELELEITGETEPCSRMDEAYDGLRQALSSHWRGGVTCRVISGARVRVGDVVTLENAS